MNELFTCCQKLQESHIEDKSSAPRCFCGNLGVTLAERAILNETKDIEKKYEDSAGAKDSEALVDGSSRSTGSLDSRDSSSFSEYPSREWGWFETGEMPQDFASGTSGRQSHSGTPLVQLPDQLTRSSVSVQALWQVGIDKPVLLGDLCLDAQGIPNNSSADRLQKLCSRESLKGQPKLMYECDNKFGGQSVSKSFECKICNEVSMIVARIPKFQVVRRQSGEQYAEFLIVVQFGTLVLNAWRRYTAFALLFEKVTKAGSVRFPNTHYSWDLLLHQKKCCRCLDEEYLNLKCFLLERFLHDLVYESEDSSMICEFIGI